METYSVLRQFADSWGMLAMLLSFLGLIVYVLFSRSTGHREAANSIFRNEDSPAAASDHGQQDGPGQGKERER